MFSWQSNPIFFSSQGSDQDPLKSEPVSATRASRKSYIYIERERKRVLHVTSITFRPCKHWPNIPNRSRKRKRDTDRDTRQGEKENHICE